MADNVSDTSGWTTDTYMWRRVVWAGPVNLTGADAAHVWLVVDAREINGTYPAADRAYWRMTADADSGDQGRMAQRSSSGWAYLAGYDLTCILAVVRTNAANATWTGSAAGAGLTVQVGEGAVKFDSDTDTAVLAGIYRGGRVDVLVEGDTCVQVPVEWEGHIVRVVAEEEEGEPAGRYPDHLDHKPWEPGPWHPHTWLEAVGWHLFHVVTIATVTLVVWGFVRTYGLGRMALAVGLCAVFVYGFVLVTWPYMLDPAVKFSARIWGWAEWRNWPRAWRDATRM